jgi:hypothetical protein
MKTREFINGQWVTVDDQFRSYTDPAQSSADYLALLNRPRYAGVLQAPDLAGAIDAVGASGYATDPDYTAKLNAMAPKTPDQQAFYEARKAELAAAGADPVRAELGARQSALETGWGRSAPGQNYYGIKGTRPDVRQASATAGASTDTDRTPTGDPRRGTMDTQSPLLDPTMLARLGVLPQVGGQTGPWQDPGPRNSPPQYRKPIDPMMAAIMGMAAGAQGGGGFGGAMSGLGMAGNAMTDIEKNDLLANKAMAEQWRLDEEMSQKRQELDQKRQLTAARGSGLSPNIQEMLTLKQMYPNMPDSEIMSMAFAGRMPQGGTKVEKVGDRLFNVGYDPMGRPQYSPLSPDEQAEYERTIGSQKKVEKMSETFGKAQVDTLINVSGAYQKAAGALDTTNNLLRRFESGEFDSAVGPVAGRIGQWFDPKTAQIQAMEMSAALANLGIENLAPVSNYEIDLIRKMDASAFQNKAQNIAVLKDLAKVRSAKADALKRALGRLKTESIEEYLANPETIKVDMGAPDTASPARSESPAAAPAPADGSGWSIRKKE